MASPLAMADYVVVVVMVVALVVVVAFAALDFDVGTIS